MSARSAASHADLELPRDAGRILKLVQFPHRGETLGRQRADIRDGAYLGAEHPARASARTEPITRTRARVGELRSPGGRGLDSRRVRAPEPLAEPPEQTTPETARARRSEAERREARGQGKPEGDRNPDEQEQPEVANHRGRGELQGEEARRRGQAGGGDRRGAAGGGTPRRLAPLAPALHSLVIAGLELDRVVDGKPDQDRQHGDRGHRQRAAEEAEETEGERRRGERDGKRQESKP